MHWKQFVKRENMALIAWPNTNSDVRSQINCPFLEAAVYISTWQLHNPAPQTSASDHSTMMFHWHPAMLDHFIWASIDCDVNTLPLISTADYKLLLPHWTNTLRHQCCQNTQFISRTAARAKLDWEKKQKKQSSGCMRRLRFCCQLGYQWDTSSKSTAVSVSVCRFVLGSGGGCRGSGQHQSQEGQ